MKKPIVSVIMSVFNGQQYVGQAVQSVLKQTFADFEFIIIDDGSSDLTWEHLVAYRDPRIRLFRNQENVGLTKSLNKGLALAKGKYVARQDADDLSFPLRLEKQVTFLERHPEVVLISAHYEVIDPEGNTLGLLRRKGDPGLVAWSLLFYNHLAGHSLVMYRRHAVVGIGGYSEARPYSQDYDLWLRLSKVGDIVILPEVLLRWRKHDAQISDQARSEQEAHALELARNGISELLGEELSLDETKDLKGFWLCRFPKARRAAFLHAKLGKLCQAFRTQRLCQGVADHQISYNIRREIGERLIHWAQCLTTNCNRVTVMKLLIYSLAWYPKGTLVYGLAGIRTVGARVLRR
ncbi:MAG: glycosyltransferase [Deltaproteobacteria bacterium]|nr:MAG: glycosyltransferase [Deltaproteobacteria bacterium]